MAEPGQPLDLINTSCFLVIRTQAAAQVLRGVGLRPLAPGPAPAAWGGPQSRGRQNTGRGRLKKLVSLQSGYSPRSSSRSEPEPCPQLRCGRQLRSRGFPSAPRARREASGSQSAARGPRGWRRWAAASSQVCSASRRQAGDSQSPAPPPPRPTGSFTCGLAPPGAAKATCPCPPWAALARAAADPQVMRSGSGGGSRGQRTQGQRR